MKQRAWPCRPMVTSHDERCSDCGDFHRLIRLDKLTTDAGDNSLWIEGEDAPGATWYVWAVMVDPDGIAYTECWTMPPYKDKP